MADHPLDEFKRWLRKEGFSDRSVAKLLLGGFTDCRKLTRLLRADHIERLDLVLEQTILLESVVYSLLADPGRHTVRTTVKAPGQQESQITVTTGGVGHLTINVAGAVHDGMGHRISGGCVPDDKRRWSQEPHTTAVSIEAKESDVHEYDTPQTPSHDHGASSDEHTDEHGGTASSDGEPGGYEGESQPPSVHTDLHIACMSGDLAGVRHILSQHLMDINSRGQVGWTPVMEAARTGNIEVVELLVSEGADVSLVDDRGDNILHLVCFQGNLEMVKYILSNNMADINSKGMYDRTPVIWAGGWGHRELLEFLVNAGADVSLTSDGGDNVLHYASGSGHLETVKYVLSQAMAQINSRGLFNTTAVMRAVHGGHIHVVELLVGKGADVSLVNDFGDNILHKACEGGHMEMVEYVLSQTMADINSRGRDKCTPAMKAAALGHREIVELLVNRGADLSLVDNYGDNILHTTCKAGGDLEMVEFVLSLGMVDINARNNSGKTAAMISSKPSVKDLLQSREVVDIGQTTIVGYMWCQHNATPCISPLDEEVHEV